MKRFLPLLTASLLVAFSTFAQDEIPDLNDIPQDETGAVVYTEVVDVPGASVDELQNRANAWVNANFKNPSKIFTEKDTEKGKWSGKHSFYIYKDVDDKPMQAGQIKYSIELAFKEGKYKYTFSEIFKLQTPKIAIEQWLDEESPQVVDNYNYLNQIDELLMNQSESLKETMSKPIPETNEDDW